MLFLCAHLAAASVGRLSWTYSPQLTPGTVNVYSVAWSNTAGPANYTATLTRTVGKRKGDFATVIDAVSNAMSINHGVGSPLPAADISTENRVNLLGIPPVPAFPTMKLEDALSLAEQGLQSSYQVSHTVQLPPIASTSGNNVVLKAQTVLLSVTPNPQVHVWGNETDAGGNLVGSIEAMFMFDAASSKLLGAKIVSVNQGNSLDVKLQRTGP